mmetsp:Transcript_36405/g.81017  ORF Transcript_36405/g.81017 Transcript_36405/m.81017 type:complete len:304 (+) Transcript_36405:53-964(+)
MSGVAIGSTRSLTKKFKELRDQAKPKTQHAGDTDLEGKPFIDNKLEADKQNGTATAPWIATSEKIRAEMGILKEKLSKLQGLHKQALLVTFDQQDDSESHVEAVTRDIQTKFRSLSAEIEMMGKTPVSEEDAPVRHQVQRHLAQALFKLSHEFRKEETRFLNKVEQQKGLAAGSSTGMVVLESGATELVDPGFSLQEIQSVNFSHALAEDRDREIQKIVDTISELAQIIKDLSVLVVEQGTMLDRIDTGIQATAIKIEDGVRELVRAEKSQKQGRMFLCIIVLVVLIVVMLIVVMAKAALKFG